MVGQSTNKMNKGLLACKIFSLNDSNTWAVSKLIQQDNQGFMQNSVKSIMNQEITFLYDNSQPDTQSQNIKSHSPKTLMLIN